MGSSGGQLATFVAVFCGVLYLVFDAARYFVQQTGPVRLRRLSSDGENGRRPWLSFDPANFHLVSGALLQMSLIGAVASTIMAQGTKSLPAAVFVSVLLWTAIVVGWKFILVIIPERAGELALHGLIPISNFFYYLFWPVLHPLRRLMARLDREEEEEDEEEPTEEEVQAYIDVGEEEGILEASEGRLVQSIVDFGDKLAHELMTPRIDVLAFDASGSMDELARLFSESKYSRIPIYRENIDRIIGIVHIKDLFDCVLRGEKKDVAELARPAYFTSATKRVSELLRELQSEHLQVAVVVDEFGGTAGIITIEDILEEIVGEIADEHEEEESTIVDLGDGGYLVSGSLRVEALEEMLDADLAGEDYETVAGLIFTSLGRIPKPGTSVVKNGYCFEVDRADRRRIYRVKITRQPEETETVEEER
ncbi:MAG TPA: hemolysin family protein [Thermoanaerobaculia bacterium]|nr:hemolysin family protein [Thermoanaerobaculia bacterium]